jgi:hypothetical protein
MDELEVKWIYEALSWAPADHGKPNANAGRAPTSLTANHSAKPS